MSDDAVARFEKSFGAHQRRVTLQAIFGWLLFLACFVGALLISNVTLDRLIAGWGKLGDYVHLMLPDLARAHLFDDVHTKGSIAYWYYGFPKWAAEIWQSVEMALLATAFGFLGAFLWSFPAARNLGVPRILTWLVRRLLELCRTVPELVSALIFVFAFGIGPIAGVLAIAMHTTGSLGKLFSEVHENIDVGPVEGVKAAGASWVKLMRFGIVPQVLPNLLSYTLLRFEVNVAASTVIGVVGAGGIGQDLRKWIDFNTPQDSFAMILMIIAVIFVIDLTSERVRTLFQRGRMI
ncbi:MAG TPA: phosphonate ABC transporter, permease protein PhnE [Alphaproteobacteria bacterium]|nr:phosphonate ABC transporter, permease protein PhnE [Alphaproteobacteria bacterium]